MSRRNESFSGMGQLWKIAYLGRYQSKVSCEPHCIVVSGQPPVNMHPSEPVLLHYAFQRLDACLQRRD